MSQTLSRRKFLQTAATSAMVAAMPTHGLPAPADGAKSLGLDFPLIDFHAHVEAPVTLERALQLAKERGVKLGVPEHGGREQVIHDDETLKQFLARLAPYPVYKGMQAEGLDWPRCFSKEAVAQLDYVLSDALTFPERVGRRVRLWTQEAKVTDKQDFMDRYVAFNVQVISEEPIDILANPTFLPDVIVKEYDALWTHERMKKVIAAAVEHHVAIEINSRYNIPSLAFLKLAKKAGVKFSFGTNSHDESLGKLDYSVEMAKELGLIGNNMFMPAPPDRKPILWRKIPA